MGFVFCFRAVRATSFVACTKILECNHNTAEVASYKQSIGSMGSLAPRAMASGRPILSEPRLGQRIDLTDGFYPKVALNNTFCLLS